MRVVCCAILIDITVDLKVRVDPDESIRFDTSGCGYFVDERFRSVDRLVSDRQDELIGLGESVDKILKILYLFRVSHEPSDNIPVIVCLDETYSLRCRHL